MEEKDDNFWSSLLDIVKLITKGLIHFDKKRNTTSSSHQIENTNHVKSKTQKIGSITFQPAVPQYIRRIQFFLERIQNQYILHTIVIGYSTLILFYFTISRLLAFFLLNIFVLVGVIVSNYNIPVIYKGYKGWLFRFVVWAFITTAITVSLFMPVSFIDGLVEILK